MNSYLTHLNLEYDEDLLLSEVKELNHVEFAKEYHYFRPTWLRARLTEYIELYPNINKLFQLFPGSTIVSYRQQANTSVFMHKDGVTECAVNILFGEENSPITFEDIGDVYYKCALVNTQKMHCVKTVPRERILLKFAYLNHTYEDIKNDLELNLQDRQRSSR